MTNILWISLEDTSPRFGCYGDPIARTPNIDRLAAEGCRFPHAFSVAGVCAPSRSAIITGMYPTYLGTHHMRTAHTNRNTPDMPTPYEAVPPHYVKAFPEYLRAAGYYCSNNQKTDYQFAAPITAWDDCSDTAHWRNRKPGQPFFAVFNPTITHESGMWPRNERNFPLDPADKALMNTDPHRVFLPPTLPDTPKTRQALAQHYDNIAIADRRVGQLLAQLEEDGLADDTIVILWSDHGEGLPRAKRWPYDAGIRIPLIVRWPGQVDPGTLSEQLVSLIDLGPTMLSLAGLPIPAHMQGQPFLGPQTQARDYVFATRDRFDEAYDIIRAVRDSRYKYIRHYRPDLPYLLWIPYRNRHPIMQELWRLHAEDGLNEAQSLLFQPRPVEELYDTTTDPHETRNLANDPDHFATLGRLCATLDAWRKDFDRWGDVAEADMVRQWYPQGEQPRTASPIIIPLSEENPGLTPLGEVATLRAASRLQLHCATQGASIAYMLETDEITETTQSGASAHWHLYTKPLTLPPGQVRLRTKAIRIGYQESQEQLVQLKIMA